MADIDPYGSYKDPLREFALTLKPKKILEIGIGHHALSTEVWLANTSASLLTIDKGDWGQNSGRLQNTYGERFNFICGRSEEVMPTLKGEYDLIFIDGDHSFEGAYADIKNAIPLLTKNGVLLIDDYGVIRSAIDLDETGNPYDGDFGVKDAADALVKDWPRVLTHIALANGAIAVKRP